MYQDLTGTAGKRRAGGGLRLSVLQSYHFGHSVYDTENFCRSGKENAEVSLSGCNFLTKEKEEVMKPLY